MINRIYQFVIYSLPYQSLYYNQISFNNILTELLLLESQCQNESDIEVILFHYIFISNNTDLIYKILLYFNSHFNSYLLILNNNNTLLDDILNCEIVNNKEVQNEILNLLNNIFNQMNWLVDNMLNKIINFIVKMIKINISNDDIIILLLEILHNSLLSINQNKLSDDVVYSIINTIFTCISKNNSCVSISFQILLHLLSSNCYYNNLSDMITNSCDDYLSVICNYFNENEDNSYTNIVLQIVVNIIEKTFNQSLLIKILLSNKSINNIYEILKYYFSNSKNDYIIVIIIKLIYYLSTECDLIDQNIIKEYYILLTEIYNYYYDSNMKYKDDITLYYIQICDSFIQIPKYKSIIINESFFNIILRYTNNLITTKVETLCNSILSSIFSNEDIKFIIEIYNNNNTNNSQAVYFYYKTITYLNIQDNILKNYNAIKRKSNLSLYEYLLNIIYNNNQNKAISFYVLDFQSNKEYYYSIYTYILHNKYPSNTIWGISVSPILLSISNINKLAYQFTKINTLILNCESISSLLNITIKIPFSITNIIINNANENDEITEFILKSLYEEETITSNPVITLTIINSKLNSKCIDILCDYLSLSNSSNLGLKYLILSNNQINDINNLIYILLDKILSTDSLELLDISYNNNINLSNISFYNLLSKSNHLASLNISGCIIEDIEVIKEMILKNTSLQEMKIEDIINIDEDYKSIIQNHLDKYKHNKISNKNRFFTYKTIQYNNLYNQQIQNNNSNKSIKRVEKVKNKRWSIGIFVSNPLVWKDSSNNYHCLDEINYTDEINTLYETVKENNKSIKVIYDYIGIDKLRSYLSTETIHILHFSFHCSKQNIFLEDNSLGLNAMSLSDFTNFFKSEINIFSNSNNKQIYLIFLSACNSKELGLKLITIGIPFVICIDNDKYVVDKTAIKFTKYFYQALFNNKYSIYDAYNIASSVQKSNFIILSESYLFSVTLFSRLCNNNDNDSENDDITNNNNPFVPTISEFFVDRKVEIYKVLNSCINRKLTIVEGENGIGKSSICYMVCKKMMERKILNGNIYYIDMVNIKDMNDILNRIIEQMKYNSLPVNERAITINELIITLKETDHLIFLDNLCENVVNHTVSFIQSIVSSTNNTHILITSKNRLNVTLVGCIANYIPILPLDNNSVTKLIILALEESYDQDILLEFRKSIHDSKLNEDLQGNPRIFLFIYHE